MINEDMLEDCIQADNESTKKLQTVSVTVYYSGQAKYEYEDCTLEEAMEWARVEVLDQAFTTELEINIDEVEAG